MAVYAITVSANYTDGPSATIYYNTLTARYYSTEDCSKSIRSFAPFTRECFAFTGYWSSTSGGTQYADTNGNFTQAFLDRVWSGTGTISAQWTRRSYKVAINANEGSVGISALYKAVDGGEVYADSVCEGSPATVVALPTRSGYTCRGVGSATWAANTAIIDQDGNVTEYFRNLAITADTSRTAAWLVDYNISLNAQGGYEGTEKLVWDRVRSAFKADQIEIPRKEGFHFLGYYSSTAAAGVQRIDASGVVNPDWVPTADATIYAKWDRFMFKITVSKGSGTGGTSYVYYNQDTDKFYEDAEYTREFAQLDLPFYEFFRFLGCYSTNATTGALYFDETGAITNELRTAARSFTDNVTVYAQYTRLCWKVTISANSGTFDPSNILYGKVGGGVYADERCQVELANILLPYRELYAFTGVRLSNNDTSDLYINPDGTFTSAFRTRNWTAAVTVYARWTQVSLKITISPNSGTFLPRPALYYKSGVGGVYNYWLCEGAVAESIPMPVRANYAFRGCYSTNALTGVQYIDADGNLTPDLKNISMTAAKTIYAQWTAAIKVTLNNQGVTTFVSYDSYNTRWMDETGAVIESVQPPTRSGYAFLGYFTAASGGEMKIDPDGEFVSGFAPTAAVTLYAQWGDFSYPISIDVGGGHFDVDTIYYRVGEGGFYSDVQCTNQIASIAIPTKTASTFAGVWSAQSGGTEYIDENGYFTVAFLALVPTGPMQVYARWTGQQFTITFNYNGGSGLVPSKSVTYGTAIGALPSATRPGSTFEGWYIMGARVSSATVFLMTENVVATARWSNQVGDVTDYFGIGSANLVPIESDSGDNKKRFCVSHTGKYEPGVYEDSGVWRNPTVKYKVIGNCTVTTTLGKAWGGSGTSGYMLTSVEVSTGIGEFPIVTLSACANEGVNAINLFNVSIPVQANAHAQNLLSSITGGGHLQALTMRAVCDPVVIAENMMPCASDVVHGRYEVSAETIANANQGAPTASNSFVLKDYPKREGDGVFATWNIQAERIIT